MPFLAHLSKRLTGELIVYRHASIVHQLFQTTSPQKPLGQLKPNFLWSLHWSEKQQFLRMVTVTWPRWPPCPYMVKTFKNLLLQNRTTDDLESWYAALGTQVLQIPSNDDLTLTFDLFMQRSSLVPFALYGKMLKWWITQKLLKSMIEKLIYIVN